MKDTRKMTMAGLCVALALVLPFLTGQIPDIGGMLCPMHIPVLLCGLLCGWPWGLAVGAVSPILRSLFFNMPPLFPTATAMAFELAAYGVTAGVMVTLLPKKRRYLYVALITAMIVGRMVWGIVMWIIMGATGGSFTWAAFVAGALTNAIPGIILHVAIIPLITMRIAPVFAERRA